MIGGVRGSQITPIMEELECLFSANRQGDVILIDDARLFIGRGYPTLEALVQRIREYRSHTKVEVRNDIIRITQL